MHPGRESIEQHVLRNRNVVGIGLGSLLSDAGHEMATSVLPGFLASLGAPAVALGAIEGIADGALSVSKLAGGHIADKPGVSRTGVTAAGYAITAVGHGVFGLVTSWPLLGLARAVSWIARGGKAPARDAILAGSVPPHQLGRAFGVERAMDSLGAIVGPLAAAPLIGYVGYRWLFGISVIPGLLAAVAVLVFVVATKVRVPAEHEEIANPIRTLARTPGPFRTLLAGVGLYGLGNFSATLLILRAAALLHGHGRSLAHASAIAVLLYAVHNAANVAAAYPAGVIADRIPRRIVLMSGVALFGVACLAFLTEPRSVLPLAGLFAAVGASTALVETGEGSYAAEILPEPLRGRGFGVLGLVDGVGDLVSSIVVGTLWTITSPNWGFAYAAMLSIAGAVTLALAPRASTA